MNRTFSFLGFVLALLATPLLANPDLVPLGPFGGDVRSMAIHPVNPDRVFLGTADGQIFVSGDRGLNWKKLIPGLKRRDLVVDSLVFHPQNPDILYAGGWELKSDRGVLYRTDDAGASWSRLDLGFFESSIRAVAVSPANPRTIAVGITEGVLLSQDEGQTWNRITRGYRSLHYVHSLAFDPFEEGRLYVGTWRLAWKTNDLGKTWEAIHEGMNFDSDLFSLQVDPRNPDTILAGACSGIYRSNNRGDLWTKLKRGLPGEAKRTRAVLFDPNDPQTMYSGTTEGLYRSRDRGDSWVAILPGVVINSVVVNPSNSQQILLGTDDAGVLLSLDGGSSFRESNNGFSHRQISSVAVRPGRPDEYFAAAVLDGEYGGLFTSTDQGKSWTLSSQGLGAAAATITRILPSSSREVWLGSSRGVHVGVPGEVSWQRVVGTEKLIVNDLGFADPKETELLIAATDGIFRLEADRKKIRKLKIPVYDRQVLTIYTTPDHRKIFIGTEMGVFVSQDRGDSWKILVDGLPYVTVNEIRLVGSRLFCGTRNGLFVSNNEGEQWSLVDDVFPIEISAIEQASEDGTHVIASDSVVGYLFLSRDGGDSWEPIEVGLTMSRVSSLTRTLSGDVLAGTLSEGVFQIVAADSGGSSVAVAAAGR